MTYVVLGLHAEGGSDVRFFQPLLLRATRDAAVATVGAPVEVQERMIVLTPADRSNDHILKAAIEACNALHLLFLHTDGRGNPAAAAAARITPISEALRQSVPSSKLGCVGVIPVHETEAWMLADGDAIRKAYGTTRSDADLGLPGDPRAVETIEDPKGVLREVHLRALGGRIRRRRSVAPPYDLLGELVDIERLRRLSAYQSFTSSLNRALAELFLQR